MVALSDNMRGAVFMMGTMAAYTFNDAFMQVLGRDVPLFQLLLLRGIGTTLFLLWLTRRMGQLRWKMPKRDWWLICLRSVAEAIGSLFFLLALFNMPLANLSAILQILPLSVTLASVMFLREKIGWRRFVAILIGFSGMLLIVRPETDGFSTSSLYGLAVVACVTLRDISARQMSSDVPSLMVSLVAAGVITFLAALISIWPQSWLPQSELAWVRLNGLQWLYLGLATGFVIIGYVLSVSAMRTGEVGFVTPFRYTSLLVALTIDATVFHVFPDVITLLGAAIVVATGLYTLLREWQLRRTGKLMPIQPAATPGRSRGL